MPFKLKLVISLTLACCLFVSPSLASEADGSTVKITSPQNGSVVSHTFDLTYELSKGIHGDHVHTYLDGKYQKGFKGTFHGISPGKHQITVKVANHDHDVLAASDSIEIDVE